jgi:CRP-like cAMP-binding protein
MGRTQRLQELAGLLPFSGLSLRDLTQIDRVAKPMRVEAGTVLVREGTIGRQAFLVVNGAVEIVTGEPERRVAVVERGGWLGEMALVSGAHRSATARTLTQVDALAFDATAFQWVESRVKRVAVQVQEVAKRRASELAALVRGATTSP